VAAIAGFGAQKELAHQADGRSYPAIFSDQDSLSNPSSVTLYTETTTVLLHLQFQYVFRRHSTLPNQLYLLLR